MFSVKAKERDKPQPIDYGVGYESAAPRWRDDPVSSNSNRTNTHAVLYKYILNFFHVYGCFTCLCVCAHHNSVPTEARRRRWVPQGVQLVVSCLQGAGNQTWVHGKPNSAPDYWATSPVPTCRFWLPFWGKHIVSDDTTGTFNENSSKWAARWT